MIEAASPAQPNVKSNDYPLFTNEGKLKPLTPKTKAMRLKV